MVEIHEGSMQKSLGGNTKIEVALLGFEIGDLLQLQHNTTWAL